MQEYEGFEVGRIRPPSEATSLLLRLTRNCPWNHCKFCTLYKGEKFSMRPKEHIIQDIDLIKECIDAFREIERSNKEDGRRLLTKLQKNLGEENDWAYYSALSWYKGGMKSIFLQDANSMIIKPDDMVDILKYIRQKFGDIERITSYARSHTIARISDEDLKRISDAGLNRIHIGMETACDEVLEIVKKGVDKATHILAGQKIKKTDIELSEYFMPGLGGNEFSRLNAIETADAMNQINPDFIRLRTLAVTDKSELKKDYEAGIFTRTNDTKMIEELLLLVENLDGITSYIKSDHILNLLPEVEGRLPEDKDKIISVLRWYLDLDKEEQLIFRVGRRTGVFQSVEDIDDKDKRSKVFELINNNNINQSNIDEVVEILMNRFI